MTTHGAHITMIRFYCKTIDNELSQPSSNFYTIQLEHTFTWQYEKALKVVVVRILRGWKKRGHRPTMYHSLVIFYNIIDSNDYM